MNGNQPGFRFFTISKVLSYTDDPVLVIIPPNVAEDCKEIEWTTDHPMEKIVFKLSVVKAIRNYFLNRAMDLQTPQTTADCCQDAMLAFMTSISGVDEISERRANSGGFDSMMSLNCGIANMANPEEREMVRAHRAAGGL